MLRSFAGLLVLGLCLPTTSLQAGDFELIRDDEGVTVNIGDQLFTRYLIKSGTKPILWPIIGPTGSEMTRSYPMTPGKPTEKKDHIHHRSFWFTHGDVNGVSFWHESKGGGEIVHREFVEVQSQPIPRIVTKNDWLGPDGKKHCEDVRTLTFGAEEDARWIDFDITLTATDGPARFGDTKEGSFGVRTAGTMKVDAKQGGRIVNSQGQSDGDAWGKPAAWVDYTGPVDGQTLGIAIFNHPSSFRYPTYWHVRTYGLFAANPFGLHDFQGKPSVDGSYVLKKGESFTLRYRVLFHKGDTENANVAKAFEQYQK